MKHLVTTHLNTVNRWSAGRILAKRAEVKKRTLFMAISANYCSSIFDLIAKKKKESEKRCKNGGSVQEGKNGGEDYPPDPNDSKGITYTQDVNSVVNRTVKGKEKHSEEKTTVTGVVSSTLDNQKEWENNTLDEIHNTKECVPIAEEQLYNNKVYLLKYIKQLQPNDDISKYRFATKYVMKNIGQFYENELLFILKTFARRKYKNLPLLQCSSEYFYWLCKMNKGSQRIISHYLHLCTLLNYIPTRKYIETYVAVFNYCKDEVPDTNFLFFNMIEEEINERYKDLKHIILVLYFLHKGKIKNEIYDTLLHMCCYYACQLSLRNSFLLLRIVLNEESGKHNLHYIKVLHRNFERHIDSMTQGDFSNYVNTLLYNHVPMEPNFFQFISMFIDKHGVELSPSAVLSILKLLKRHKFKDTVILKKVVNVIRKNFYHYTYADVVYVVKILTFLNHFDEPFFCFLFEKFLPPMGTLPTGMLVSMRGDKQWGRSLPYKSLPTDDEGRLSPGNSYRPPVRRTHFEKVDEQEDHPVGSVNLFKQVPQKKGVINELSHLPLHLYEERVKMKVEACNIIGEEEHVGRETHMREVSFGLKYLEMYVNLFIYLGICGHRAHDLLLRLSQMIRLCLLARGAPLPDQGHNQHTTNTTTTQQQHNNNTTTTTATTTTTNIRTNTTTTATIGCGHVIHQTSRFHNSLSRHTEPQFVCLHDAIKKNKKEINFSHDRRSIIKMSERESYLPPLQKGHKNSSSNVPPREVATVRFQDSSPYNSVATAIGGTKSCLRFSYRKSEKINLESLKKKKKKNSTLLVEDANKEKKCLSHLMYLNVDMFRRAKVMHSSGDLNCATQTEERGPYESTERMKRNSVLSKHFGNVHPAAMRLHNRKLFRRYFEELHPSERYTEKVPPKPCVHRGSKSGLDLRLIKYKEIRSLRNVCLRRYAHMFNEQSDETFEGAKGMHKMGNISDENGTCSYKYPFDMISDKNLIHVDDSLFLDYSMCGNNRKVALLKHSHLVRKSNQVTRKEYCKGGKTDEEKMWRENNPSGYLLKWLYRYKNCLNLFPSDDKIHIHLLDGDIKQLGECVQKWYEQSGVETTSNPEKQTEKEEAKITLKYIALITKSFSDLYHFDKALIDVLLVHVSKLFRSFYLVQKSEEQKIMESEKMNNRCSTPRETYQCMYRFTKMWRFLVVCSQVNHVVKNILSLDHRHETVTKLLHLYTSPYILLNIKHLTYVLNQMDALSKQMEKNPSLIKRFLLHYLDISAFTNIFLFFCKKLFILVTSNGSNLLMKDFEHFHTFTYLMLTLQRDYARQWIYHSDALAPTLFEGVPHRSSIQDTTFLQCLNFYVMLVFATDPRWREKRMRDQSPSLGRDDFSHLGNSSVVTEEQNVQSRQRCAEIGVDYLHKSAYRADLRGILALSLRYIKLLSYARNFPPVYSAKNKDPPQMYRDMQTCMNTHTKVRTNVFRQLLPYLQFYYLLKRDIRKKNPTNINEHTFPYIFPTFITKCLKHHGVKEVSIRELFPVGQSQHHRQEHGAPEDTPAPSSYVDTTLYYYFLNFFFF
ncbi:conserved Plasmodium protein, unknown function [Plasmodium knowlesi strain H]|uniref:Uncharacterized protein n=3 Tax=Plasmodium knowlesi TaxID=5850 RepID=A0A5K1TW28_PLAKH|nr:conserved Plasmodium protein, unknown function [Plasmodium knowlesi strain H]OTN65089.1 Uncharacterized protein PKNOH_S120148200 [Plasmodium knowlesi]CAA9988339.1 conserved Plasmodium protein, unknown function [Plasmodium knowlesi strain H]SBO20113.1 conserved Plasmodium protein, unknown function [Plasmodium knowlesi strain H]SBO20292.1 conserved Plasmodium protein, unknown function [Plasmodium knowlesi strain H]VVS77813.1 conserved Plasmodium protein, unknown function [Plasmodium knowlesi |eukprot:XP_002259318.1 hypothetical protein, conserved in Plasmodium species [Plasmodium knowlesi strain H]